NGGRERSAHRHAGSFQDGRVDGYDVGHREEGGESGDDFTMDSCLMVREFKELIEPTLQVALGGDSGLYIRRARRAKLIEPINHQGHEGPRRKCLGTSTFVDLRVLGG